MYQPEIVSDIDMAFPARGWKLKPSFDKVPKDFDQDPFRQLFWDVFTGKAEDLQLLPADDIDSLAAWRHLSVVMGCYAFKHQEKERLWCWLLSIWFPSWRNGKDAFCWPEEQQVSNSLGEVQSRRDSEDA
jgi:hypothetical protein